MGKKIAVVGLYTLPNMGDLLLCETTAYLIKQLSPDATIVKVDACPYYRESYKGIDYVKYRISRKMLTWSKKFAYENGGRWRHSYESEMWKLRVGSHYKRRLNGVDAIVFAGGGFIKYRTQGLNYYVEQIINYATSHNIPVMMNAMGIEGYDDNDYRCKRLQQAINSDVVKVITTRDDIDLLRDKYITNPNIVTARVGDPALWSPECYGIERDQDSDTVGINIIRANIFKDYGNNLSAQGLNAFYKDLIRELEARQIKWTMFTNGMKSDVKMGVKVLEELGMNPDEKLLSAPNTPLDLLNTVKGYSSVFGARLHACITSYAVDVPVVGFIWNEKTRFFSQIIDKSENFFEEDDISPSKIVDRLMTARNEKYDKSIRNNLKELTKKYIEIFIRENI